MGQLIVREIAPKTSYNRRRFKAFLTKRAAFLPISNHALWPKIPKPDNGIVLIHLLFTQSKTPSDDAKDGVSYSIA